MDEYADSLSDAIYQLEDVATSISGYATDIEDNPRRLEEIEERLDLITKLKRKYGSTIEEILLRGEEDRTELETISNRDELVATLQQQDGQFRLEIGSIAQQLATHRHEAAQHLAIAMEEQLNDLNMRRARFQVEIEQELDEQGVPACINDLPEQSYACDQTGIDRVQFLIAPNPGEPFKPLTKIASGGETSRLMLALKTILADAHYNVNKQILDDRTITIVNELRPEQRIREVAHIMGGNVTEFSMKSAEEMLGRSYLWKENWTRHQNNHQQLS
jgi:DNA repair protein RecN (Recombination protein N)